jgi:pimeloyl-ACP methyl ester carboxylesterase
MPEVSRQGVKIDYDVAGQGPPLLLMHGWGCDRTWWREGGYLDDLQTRYRVVNIDLRGHGASDKPHDWAAYRPETVIGDLLAVADAERIDRFAVWGMSYGGWVGWTAGLAAPDRVAALITSGSFNPAPETLDDWKDFESSCGETMRRDGTSGLIALYKEWDGDGYHREYPPWAEAITLDADPLALLAIQSRELFELGTGVASLESYPAPVLLIAGELEDPEDKAAANAARLPRGESLRVPGLGHGGACAAGSFVLPTACAFLDRWYA